MSLTPLRSQTPATLNSVLQANPGDRVSADKGEVAPIVAVLSRQLPLPQAQQLAGQTALVRVLKGGPGNQAELEFDGQNLSVKLPPGRQLTAGEMVTVAFALNDKLDGLGANPTGNRKVQDVRNTPVPLISTSDSAEDEGQQSPSFVDRLSGGARLIGLLERLGQHQPTTVSTQVMKSLQQLGAMVQDRLATAAAQTGQTSAETGMLAGKDGAKTASPALPPTVNSNTPQPLQKTDVARLALNPGLTHVLAQQVSEAVENSGLFYESHLQQWVMGQRSVDQLAQEPQARFGAEQIIGDKGLNPASVEQSARLVNAQLATLDQTRIVLNLPGLLGNQLQVEIEPDQHQADDPSDHETAGVRPWVARLKLDMAHLGVLHVRVRMVGSQCDVTIEGSSASKQAMDPHWGEFQQAMSQQGLKLNHGQFIAEQTHG
ncbi:flagellar hook-length control protein FliK [Limnobacter humi]|uniref:Flagellar hook-length control protein FliK n=1 Tax=Limnobacter humi TaxID=1778671 RepID=A0ABT1WJQ1_9BURK|nr:flagellar hook-length control protein FliK [Limnobacter humi]MCQ8897750.1 flagellar hook-length control protein FliK [Limnobacter humi]